MEFLSVEDREVCYDLACMVLAFSNRSFDNLDVEAWNVWLLQQAISLGSHGQELWDDLAELV